MTLLLCNGFMFIIVSFFLPYNVNNATIKHHNVQKSDTERFRIAFLSVKVFF